MKTGSVSKGVLEDIFLLSSIMSGDISMSSYNDSGDLLATVRMDNNYLDIYSPKHAVEVLPDYQEGEGRKICTLCSDNTSKDIYAPSTDFEVVPAMYDGVDIGCIEIDGKELKHFYAPSVYFVPEFTSGIKVGTFVFNGESTDVFIPNLTITQTVGKNMDDPSRTIINMNGIEKIISADDVSITSNYNSGEQIAVVRINGQDYPIYAPKCNCPSYP